MDRHQVLTQHYSTFGNKLLQHADVLHVIQSYRQFIPITVQLAPTEVCDSDCPFCSVSGRPLKSKMSYEDIGRVLRDFVNLGAKTLEITGGGNPMLWRDGAHDINRLVVAGAQYRMKVGIITNSRNLSKLTPEAAEALSWVRVSLIQLDEGHAPEEYNFGHVSPDKIGLSYIIYEGTDKSPRLGKAYQGTTPKTIERIAKLVELHPHIKFVRIAGDCLQKGIHPEIKAKWQPIIEAVDKYQKWFIKDIDTHDGPYDRACYVGLVRPYIAQSPTGEGRPRVYICTSHVLNTRVYDLDYSLGDIDHIPEIWAKANERFQQGLPPYEVRGNCGTNWEATCRFCYYFPNNALLDQVATRPPGDDWMFA